MPAPAAQNNQFAEFLIRPNSGRVICNFFMAKMTRKPPPTAFEFQCNNVVRTGIMGTARFWIDIHATNLKAVNFPCHDGTRCLGQTSTRTNPTIQHRIITMKPVLNEPVR